MNINEVGLDKLERRPSKERRWLDCIDFIRYVLAFLSEFPIDDNLDEVKRFDVVKSDEWLKIEFAAATAQVPEDLRSY